MDFIAELITYLTVLSGREIISFRQISFRKFLSCFFLGFFQDFSISFFFCQFFFCKRGMSLEVHVEHFFPHLYYDAIVQMYHSVHILNWRSPPWIHSKVHYISEFQICLKWIQFSARVFGTFFKNHAYKID